ncbi:hypothetical protein BU17DRAFT_47068 [Hysterangium stoloniferum]|nr:hypothetical protein BU17DRAFT_47068 [Hysterangium stoloniferum]
MLFPKVIACYETERIQKSFESIHWNPSQTEVLCLGLGSPMESRTSIAQLIVINATCDALEIGHDRVSFFDPQFSEEDVRGLQEMGFHVHSENKHGKYPLHDRTLIFMPHCGLELYENLLRHNWSAKALSRLMLLGNVLQDYVTGQVLHEPLILNSCLSTAMTRRIPEWKLEMQAPCLSRIWRYLNSDILPTMDQFPTAFNNMAVQYVALNLLSGDDNFWTLPDPNTDDWESVEVR